MTPKEKAKDLFDKMYNSGDLSTFAARNCALRAVEEIICFNPKGLLYTINIHRFKTLEEIDMNFSESDGIIVEKMTALEYWQEVKQEIENKKI